MARPGWIFVLAALAVSGLGWLPVLGRWGYLLRGVGLLLAAFFAYFFRDPERVADWDPSKIYSPGDGRVLSVAREGPGEVTTLRIFLSPFDVHVQRAPVAGKVDYIHYQEGTFRMAMKDEARRNERNLIRIVPDGRPDPVVVEQIAGFLARRIACWVVEGQTVPVGTRIGMIYFGSQVAVHFRPSARVTVRPGDRVAGGITVIGEWTG